MTSTSTILKTVVNFGPSIASNAPMHTEINCLISKASETFSQLYARVFNDPKLTIRTKSAVYSGILQRNVDPVKYAGEENYNFPLTIPSSYYQN